MQIGVGLSLPLLATRRSGGFSPLSLFTSGVAGAWYDPSDYSTLFQDSAGTTPVTAVEQPVRLMLDKSQGLVLGSELVTNGDFATDTAWTKGTGITISGGQCICTSAASSSSAFYQSASVTVGKWYKYEIVVSSFTAGGNLQPKLFGMTTNLGTIGAAGTYVFYGSPTTANTNVGFGLAATTTCAIDSISIKELPGNHALAPNDASRPVLRARYNLLTYSEQFDNAAWVNTIAGTGVNPTVTADQGTAPDGTVTADRIQFSLGGGTTSSDISRRRQSYTTPAVAHTFSVYLRSFDGVSTYNMHLVGADGATNNIVVTGSWQRFTVTAIGTGGAVTYAIGLRGGQTPANSNTADVLAWGAQVVTGSSAGTYQRIAAATDYATAGFLPYLAADGTDDNMVIPATAISGATAMTEMHAAWRPAGFGAGNGAVFGGTGTATTNDHEPFSDGALYYGFASSARQAFGSLGTVTTPYILDATQTGTTLAAYRNGTQLSTTATVSIGIGATPRLFVSNNSTLQYYQGNFFGGLLIKKVLSAAETSAARSWFAAKAGITL